MIGLITQAVGAAAGLISDLIPNKEVTETYKTYMPDPLSIRNAGLFGAQVNLGEQTHTNVLHPNAEKKQALAETGAFTQMIGGLMNTSAKDPAKKNVPKEPKTITV